MRRRVTGSLVVLLVGTIAGVVPARPAFANVACGHAITQDTTLTHELHCPGGSGLHVVASDVTLDLGGHSITGPDPSVSMSNAGISILSGQTGVTVRNGSVKGFFVAVGVNPEAYGAHLSGLTITDTGIGIATFTDLLNSRNTRSATIMNNTVSGTTSTGVQISGDHHEVRNNTVEMADNAGIMVSGNHNLVVGNIVNESGANNIVITRFPDKLDPSVGNRIANNAVSRGGRIFNSGNIDVRLAENTIIEANVINGRAGVNQPGIFVSQSDQTQIASNAIVDTGSAIVLRGAAGDTTIERNLLRDNQFGIFVDPVDGAPTGTVVSENVARRNRFDGIRVTVPGTLVRANLADRNGQWGIFAVDGVIDGGGNRASRNGVSAQCTPNIAC